jgi:hypothetical protein
MTRNTRAPSALERTQAPVCCRRCGKSFTSSDSLAYARANELTLYIPEYHRLGTEHLAAQYQQHQIQVFRTLMDYDRVLAWASTVPWKTVGWAGQRKYHPLRRFLNDVDPPMDGRFRWDIFPCMCEAKALQSLPQTGVTAFSHFRIQECGVTFTIHIPLPRWTHQLIAHLEALPFHTPITREHLYTLLHAQV